MLDAIHRPAPPLAQLEDQIGGFLHRAVADGMNGNGKLAFSYLRNTASKLTGRDPNVALRPFPKEVLDHLKAITDEIVAEWVAKDPKAAKIYESFNAFREKSILNQRISEQAFLETRL